MSRRKFIESLGATCGNWTWSWSFVNESKRIVIFGAWDTQNDGSKALILSEDWRISRRGRRQPAYDQSREHIRLVEEKGYQLQTFPMLHSREDFADDTSPSKIKGFIKEVTDKTLIRIGRNWYAANQDTNFSWIPEQLAPSEVHIEGASSRIYVNRYERDRVARDICIDHFGYKCAVCEFDFEETYGLLGRHFIHVHHITPLSETNGSHEVDPIKDLVPICPNCHAMIHSTRPALLVGQLRDHLQKVVNS